MSDQTTLEVVLSSESILGNPIVETVTVVGTVPIGPRGPQGDPGADSIVPGPQGDPGEGVPTGGTEGQVLAKASATDFDTEWVEQTGGGGSGVVETIVAGSNIDVDATDPANPIVSVETLVDADIPASIARDSEVTSAIATSEAGQVRDGDAAGGVLAGTYPNPSFAADMATQSELDTVESDLATAIADGDASTLTSANAHADNKVAQSITNGVTTSAPSQDQVFDALALKANLASPTFTGDVVVPDANADTEAMNRQTSDARYAPKDLQAVFASTSAALTTHVPNNVTMEQWGTEEAVIAQADAPTSAVVLAWLTGSAGFATAGPGAVGDRGECRLEVSFDGGGSFATLGDAGVIITMVNITAGTRMPLAATGRATGTVTGDIQVRAMCRDVDGAGDFSFADGIILAMVHPQ